MSNRFYSDQSLEQPTVTLTGAEAHHLLHVLRMRAGDAVVLFDGNGTEADGRIVSMSRSSVDVEIGATRQPSREREAGIVLATAVPKGERFRWLVEKATELGVERLIPLQTERSVVVPGSSKLDKLRQTVIAAAKQCGRSRLMQIEPAATWNEFLERERSAASAGVVLVAHPTGEPLRRVMPVAARAEPAAEGPVLVLAVGPEGGLTEAEIEQSARHGARLVGLGPHILRVETAAIAFVSYCRLHSAGAD